MNLDNDDTSFLCENEAAEKFNASKVEQKRGLTQVTHCGTIAARCNATTLLNPLKIRTSMPTEGGLILAKSVSLKGSLYLSSNTRGTLIRQILVWDRAPNPFPEQVNWETVFGSASTVTVNRPPNINRKRFMILYDCTEILHVKRYVLDFDIHRGLGNRKIVYSKNNCGFEKSTGCAPSRALYYLCNFEGGNGDGPELWCGGQWAFRYTNPR